MACANSSTILTLLVVLQRVLPWYWHYYFFYYIYGLKNVKNHDPTFYFMEMKQFYTLAVCNYNLVKYI